MSEAQEISIEQIRAAWEAVSGQHESIGIDDEVTQQYQLVGDAIDELDHLLQAKEELRRKVNVTSAELSTEALTGDRALAKLLVMLTSYFGGSTI